MQSQSSSTSYAERVSGKSAHNKVIPKQASRTSKFYCQERLACKGQRPEAHYQCRECGTFQCQTCEELLHENAKLVFHDRERLAITPKELICQNDCEDKNLSDVTCKDCNKHLCFACDFKIHSQGAKKKHSREAFKAEKDDNDDEFVSCPFAGENHTDQVEPLINIDLDSEGDHNDGRSLSKSKSNKKKSPRKSDLSGPTEGRPIKSLPDIAQLSLESPVENSMYSPTAGVTVDIKMTSDNQSSNSFLLIDGDEILQVSNSEEFAHKLGCKPSTLVKVVSIFGNTGEGKSHTLNYTFFDGFELFKTSPAQSSCTIGIWCAYDPKFKVITIDTEGLLGISEKHHQRTRLLLKVLAISDIIIYRTRAPRLGKDLYTFLGDASKAYVKHFSKELKDASTRCNLSCPLSDLGPVVIIFHETLHTEILRTANDRTPEDVIRQHFQKLNLSIEAFSALEYVGTQTISPPTNFKALQESLRRHLKNSTIRSARTPTVVYTSLKLLNEKFSGNIETSIPSTFLDEYFTCQTICLSCNARCLNSMNHLRDGLPHVAPGKCKYQHQFDNQIFFCRKCNDRGEQVLVVPKTSSACDSTWLAIAKYAWAGYVLECKFCGIIYRSRQYWYGNLDPTEQSVVRTEILHVWEGEPIPAHGSQNAAQRMVDSVNYLSETVTNIGAKPTKLIGSWVADQIAPSYWMPNSRILHCGICDKEFGPLDHKHHCRACGGGFCEGCSSKFRPVPERGWGDQPVRVCDSCFEKGWVRQFRDLTLNYNAAERIGESGNPEVTARKVGEILQTSIGTVVSAIDVPLEWIKDSARPEYWIPDKDITHCNICKKEFNEKLPIHHCRGCGHGVCDDCSQARKPVPSRGWDQPSRVCDECDQKKNLL